MEAYVKLMETENIVMLMFVDVTMVAKRQFQNRRARPSRKLRARRAKRRFQKKKRCAKPVEMVQFYYSRRCFTAIPRDDRVVRKITVGADMSDSV